MSFQTFLNAVEKGLPSPVYMFYASDLFLLREAMHEIRGLVPEAERDFNLHILDLTIQGEGSITLEQILNVASTVSFFSGRRFTILSGNIQKLSKKELERLHVYTANPAEGSVFVILHNGLLGKDARDKFKALKPVPLDMRESEIPFWIKKRARIKGIEISDKAIDFLMGLHGPDLGLLAAEIEKISLLGKEIVKTDDISEIATGGRLYSIFDLTNALRERDTGRVFRIYKTLRETSDDYSLIGALNWQYGRYIHSGDKNENEYLLRVFELLNSVDKDIKSSGRIFPMEYLLIKLLRLQEGRLPSS